MLKKITRSLVIIPMFLSAMFLVTPMAYADLSTSLTNPKGAYDIVDKNVRGGSANDFTTVISSLINVVLGFLGLILVGFLIYGGFLWMTDNGDEKQVTNAKNVLKNSVIGLVIVVLSFIISHFVIDTLANQVVKSNGLNVNQGVQ